MSQQQEAVLDLKKTWEALGKELPYWSVLTNPNYKKPVLEADMHNEFMLTGIPDVEHFEAMLNKHGETMVGKNILDFGCGVGRLTHTLCKKGAYVVGVDVSAEHLKIAKENCVNDHNTMFLEVGKTMPYIPIPIHIVVSLMVLQHNRPDQICYFVAKLIQTLAPKGIALLHIPYFIPNYAIDLNAPMTYLEMNFAPKDDIAKVVADNDAKLLEIVETDRCGGGILNCFYVIQKNENQ